MSESASTSSESSAQSHDGSCHCGAVKFTAKLDLSKPVMTCNCSICSRQGWMLAFVPKADISISGEDQLTDYQFGKHHLHHVFCKVCGVHPFSHGVDPSNNGETYGVNVRCLPDVDLDQLEVMKYDGKKL
jgi:hypothetical protein